MAACGLAAAALSALAATALPHPLLADFRRSPPPVHSVALEQGQAMLGFYRALRELQQGERDRVRVLHWGDSNIAAGIWTQPIQKALAARFGNGGPGYLTPRYGTYDHAGLISSGPAWKARRRGFGGRFGPLDGRWGLAGVAVEGRGRQAWLEARVPNLGRPGIFEVHALQQPRGGQLAVEVDEEPVAELDTNASGYGLLRQRFPLDRGPHEVDLRVHGYRPVRLLGVVLERAAPGVVYDVLGINGHRASAILDWNEELMRAQLEARKPDLVVLSYGGNEALDPNISPTRFQTQLTEVLERVDRLAPEASVLVVGPVAMCPRSPPLTKLEPRLPDMIRSQRETALAHGAAFWNSSQVMGGAYALCEWKRQSPALVSGDNLHLSRQGYTLVGEKFAEAVLAGL